MRSSRRRVCMEQAPSASKVGKVEMALAHDCAAPEQKYAFSFFAMWMSLCESLFWGSG